MEVDCLTWRGNGFVVALLLVYRCVLAKRVPEVVAAGYLPRYAPTDTIEARIGVERLKGPWEALLLCPNAGRRFGGHSMGCVFGSRYYNRTDRRNEVRRFKRFTAVLNFFSDTSSYGITKRA